MMLDTSLSCIGLPSANLAGRGLDSASFSIEALVIEGDSITSGMPSDYSNSFYSYRYQDARADLTITVRAQGSRSVGQAAGLNDDGNTLMGNVAEDMAYEPDLITALIGANDMALNSAAAYKADLAAWYAAVKTERPDCRVAWSGPIPYNPNEEHASYANFTAQRAIVMEDARDPAVWGQWADYYLPLGEHPDWIADPPLSPSLWGDGVHPTGFDALNGKGGQNRLYAQFKAAVDTLADTGRAASPVPYASVWPADETGLPAGAEVERRFIVSGIAHSGLASGLSVSGGDAEVRLNGGAWDTSVGRIYNGDVIDLKLTTSAEHEAAVTIDLTIGSETRTIAYTTAADVAPVNPVYGGGEGKITPGTTIIYGGKTFAGGVAVVAISGGTAGLLASSVDVGGVTAVLVKEQGLIQLWACPITAGDHDIVITRDAGYLARHFIQWMTLENADPSPIASSGNGGSYGAPPFLTPSLTVPANGIQVGSIWVGGGATAPTITGGGGDTIIGQGSIEYQSSTTGSALAVRTETGSFSFSDGSAWGNVDRLAVVFKALGA